MTEKRAKKSRTRSGKKDLTKTIVRRHMNEDAYVKEKLGHCARITIPLVTTDQIKAAAVVLRHAADDLEDLLGEGRKSSFSNVLVARGIIGRASRVLKGGMLYGKTR